MPRSSKSKAKKVNNIKSCNASKNLKKNQNDVKKDKCIKKDLVVDTPKESVIEEVFHRKSERRRIARDIFLVFEEESRCKKNTRANKKQAKPKFGHLKVDDPVKPKGLLRDIKNEPKCYLNDSSLSVNATTASDVQILKTNSNTLSVKQKEKKNKSPKNAAPITKTVKLNNSNNLKSIKVSKLESQSCMLSNEAKFVAKINPIFLWVKQDDTRIVEVRCEDYDKRNRIRITKTSNGWRSIPRSDPTTSRVLKYYPTPLMKVKRENTVQERNLIINSKSESNDDVATKDFLKSNILLSENIANSVSNKLSVIGKVCNPLAIEKIKSRKKKSKNVKKKLYCEKIFEQSYTSDTTSVHNTIENTDTSVHLNQHCNTNPPEIEDIPPEANINLDPKINIQLKREHDSHNVDLETNTPSHLESNDEILNTKSVSINSSSTIGVSPVTKFAYQNENEKEFLFHLCPKTGFFLPNNASFSVFGSESNKNGSEEEDSGIVENTDFVTNCRKELNIETEKIILDPKVHIPDENTESLEAKTKNLKDLLDDADLLQNCDDNANSDADLIDSLVKTSCENNLIQANEITKANNEPEHQKTLNGTSEMVVQLLSDVSDPPKFLSFNEAGEIEGINGEIFQSNSYIESFDKQPTSLLTEPQLVLHSTTSVAETSAHTEKIIICENIEPIAPVPINNNLVSVSEIDDSPKDLSYKKREEVCPPPESRSQCAVTSSSDVIKSPQTQEPSSLTSTSETLKNIILEQFMKLNTLNIPHQSETKEAESQIHSDMSNMKSIYTSKSAQSNDFIETVIIQDDNENVNDIEHDEPLKKRLRLKKPNVIKQNMDKLAMIDKDPDPLTQLRLLIRNTQWKVPDPILVPKDRLSAVLASPAREIPLLITTRPELRLPDAFAYPEIIQNPNILVISMAQLEAILKNEIEVDKSTAVKAIESEVKMQKSAQRIDCELKNQSKDLPSPSLVQNVQNMSKQDQKLLTTTSSQQDSSNVNRNDMGHKLSKSRQEYEQISQTDLSQTSEFNPVTMAVLNQMLWLPYFGQISHDIGKSIQNPVTFQEKCANTTPFFNDQRNVATNTAKNKISDQSASYTSDLRNFQQQFKTPDDVLLFRKIVQHQIQSVLQINQLTKSDSAQTRVSVVAEDNIFPTEKSKSKNESSSNLIEQQRKRKGICLNKQKDMSMSKSQTFNCGNSISLLQKSYNLRSSVAGRQTVESKQYSNNNQRQIGDDKPRLTCKSLSNLLEPEHNTIPSSSSSVQYVQNLSTDVMQSVSEIKRSSGDYKINNIPEHNGQFMSNASSMVSPSQSNCNNVAIESSHEFAKIRDNNISTNDAPDTNTPLWHPLFGSNNKTQYSSPWQWTTVTATGE